MTGTIGEGRDDEKRGDAQRREVPYLGVVKVAAVVMGIMIVVGIAVIGVTIAKRLSGTTDEAALQARTPQLGADPARLGDLDIAVPPGARVDGMVLEGRRLAIHLAFDDGHSAILLIDAETGASLGLLRLIPEER